MRVPVLMLIGVLAVGSAASAQSLADVAKRETERRQEVKGAGKVYTNSDLKPVPQPAGSAPEASADTAAAPAAAAGADGKAPEAAATPGAEPAAGAGADGSAKPPDSASDAANKETRDQAWWAKRMADLKEQLERDQTFRDALQSRIDALATDFVNRDDPAQRNQIAADRQKALAELERVKKSIEEGRKAIPALEEEARRDGVPAGWLR